MLQAYAGTAHALDDSHARLIASELAQGEYSWMTFPDLWWVCMQGIKCKYDPDGLFGTLDPSKFFRWCNTHREQRQEACRQRNLRQQEEDIRLDKERQRIVMAYAKAREKAMAKTTEKAPNSSPNAIKNILGIGDSKEGNKDVTIENLKKQIASLNMELKILREQKEKLAQQIANFTRDDYE